MFVRHGKESRKGRPEAAFSEDGNGCLHEDEGYDADGDAVQDEGDDRAAQDVAFLADEAEHGTGCHDVVDADQKILF